MLDEKRYALDLSIVGSIHRIVEITSLPKVPDVVQGVINVRGTIVPVVNIRRRFSLPERQVNLSDQLIIAHTRHRSMAIVVDQVIDVVPVPQSALVDGSNVVPGIEYVDGILKLPDGMVLIHDLDKFLSIGEAEVLESAIARHK